MFRILDRYLVREIVLPFVLGLLVLTFVLEIPPILREAEALIAKGVEWTIVAQVLLTLLPQALSITIPMALLLGILVGLGRLSADREFVALQACGVSLFRLLRPVALLALLATAATAYETIVALPDTNQTFREITTKVVADRLESNVKPRVFFEDFPNRVIYARDVRPGGGWRDVFLADASRTDQTTVYFAREGRLVIDREKRLVQLVLSDGRRHTTFTGRPEEYEGSDFTSLAITLDPESVFPRPPAKGPPEMTIAELRATIAEGAKHGDRGLNQLFMIQQKFSIPAACAVLALVGLALGFSHRKDGKLASFVLGFIVIFVYYVLLWSFRALAIGGRFPPAWAPWIPNLVLGACGVALLLWRSRVADQPIRINLPAFWSRGRAADPSAAPAPAGRPGAPARRRRAVVVLRVPHLNLPRPALLDVYVSTQYLRIFCLGVVSLLGIFYISTFMDLADKLFRGQATSGLLLRYFWYQTPQFVYYVIPMAALVATLVTIGVMTKNSELIVMRACGISLYRAAVPIVLFALAASAVLFGLQERVLAHSNREADRLNAVIRGFAAQTFGTLDRGWKVGKDSDIYHYDLFDARANRFSRLTLYHFDEKSWRLSSLLWANEVALARTAGGGPAALAWRARQGWTREFTAAAPAGRRRANVRSAVKLTPFTERDVPLEPPEYFKTESPDAQKMTYAELRGYITQLQASGFDTIPSLVELHRKVAFPFVTLVMTLIAVPFAVTTGRRGALYGIGIGIVLAIVYWITLSLFAALGQGGLIAPTLAAWAPNIIFGAAAVYLVLTVRT